MGSAARRVRRLWGTLRRELRVARSAALTLALGLILTACATGYVARQVADDERASLDREAAATEIAVADRLARYLDALQGARGLFAASAAADREDWAAYIRALDLPGRYPGTRSVAYVRWVPAADEAGFLAEMRAGGVPEYAIQGAGGAAAYAPLAYIEPLTAVSRRALGFDAFADPIRRPALERARDTGLPAATAGTALASEASGAEQRSVILYIPVYRGGGVPGTVAERRDALQGFVLTGWRMDDLMAGILGPRLATLTFVIADVSASGAEQLLYASDGAGAATTTAALARPDQRRTLDAAGRTWTLGFVARSGPDRRVPALVAGVGLALSLLLGLAARAHGLRQAVTVATVMREAAESFDSLFGASEAITINEDGRVVAINPAYTALLGWESADVVGRPGLELVTLPEDRATAIARVAMGDERPYTVGLRCKDGTTVATEVVGRAIRYHGRPARLATLRDVTARARAEAALRESEERFRGAFEHAAIGKALVGLDGRWLRVNLALCTLLDYTPDELLATNFQDLTHPDDLDADTEQIRLLLAGTIESYQMEKRYRHKEGHWVWTLVSASLMHGEAGTPLHFVKEIQDIGARKRAEEGLALLHAIAATANEAATLADAARPVLDRICDHTGWPVGHLLIGAGDGTLISTELWHPDDPTSFTALRAASAQARFAPGEGLPGRTLVGREPVWIADVTADDGFVRGGGGDLGIKAAFAFPILVGSEVVAILEFFSPVAVAPDAALLATMAQVGTQLGRVVERERAGEALRRSEVRHRAVVDTAFDAIVTASADGLIRSFNVGAERIFGHDSREVCGEPLAILMPERFRAGHSAGLARVSATGEGRLLGQTLELVGQRRDGTEFPLELTLAQGRDDQGIFFTGIMRDISARVAAEAALRQGAESFASLFEATGEGLMIHEGGTILAANPAYAALHGCAMAAVVGRDGLDFLAPASRRDAARRMRDGDERPYEAEALHCDGTTFAVEFAGRAVRYQGRQARLVALRDITARKAAETALAASHRALEVKTREQDAFLYTVAHDLRAPLLSMQGMANILREEYAPRLDDGRLYLDRIVANAEKMQALLDELLEISRVGRVDVEMAPVPLDAVVADVREQLHHALTTRGARVEIAGPLPTVRANRMRMVQLFANLIANAVHYTPQGRDPLVRIGAAPHADGWELTVADNGVGIPAAYRDKVLGLFQRLPAGRALNPGGTGAGLAIVARIVDTHEGTLWFDAAEGGGTTVHVTLPPDPGVPETIAGLNARREGLPA